MLEKQMSAIRVLLVEDDGLIQVIAADFLHNEGFEVTVAQTGDEAAGLLDAEHGLDILFTDVRMPGTLDGIDLARRARRQHPALPLLIVSGYAALLTTRLSVLDPAAAFLGKPYRLREIADTLKRLTIKA